jgi:uncharacterized membrane protein
MMHDTADSTPDWGALLRDGIAAAESGDRARARDLLARAVAKDRRNPLAWLALSEVVDDPRQKQDCLERVLALDPGHELARQRLAQLRQARTQPVGVGPVGAQHAVLPTPGAALWRSEFTVIAALGLVLLLLIALGVEGLPAPLPLLRLFLGLPFVLFVPGYALQAALFPRVDDLDGPERLALSFGLSVAVVPPLALLLDWLPWGIRLWPIVVAESLVILVCSAVALFRRYRLPPEEQFRARLQIDLAGWWAEQDRTGRILYGVLAFAFLLAAGSAIAIVALPKPGEQFTEFYILGSEGLAESYPREVAAGQAVSVTAGITNREGVPATYRIEVRVADQSIGAAGPISLADGETWQGPVQFAPTQPGDDQQILFFLYRDGDPEPYRSLRLWLNVTAP